MGQNAALERAEIFNSLCGVFPCPGFENLAREVLDFSFGCLVVGKRKGENM